jgi:hypothetical protein
MLLQAEKNAITFRSSSDKVFFISQSMNGPACGQSKNGMELANCTLAAQALDTSKDSLQKLFLLSLPSVGSTPFARNAPTGTNSRNKHAAERCRSGIVNQHVGHMKKGDA